MQYFAGISVHWGKTRAWLPDQTDVPPGLADLSLEVWRSGKPPEENGLVMPGFPIGTKPFMSKWCVGRYQRVVDLCSQLSCIENPQQRCCLLKYCVEPKINHILRNTPPDVRHQVAELHDNCVQVSLLAFLNCNSALGADVSRKVASLSVKDGGLGLRSAVCVSGALLIGVHGQTVCTSCVFVS